MVVGTMGMIYSDTRQKPGHHDIKEKWWAEHGIELERVALTVKGHAANPAVAPAGDYCADGSNVCVDTKASVDEVAGNINGKEHERFIAEIERAASWGYRLVILVENELGYANMGDVLRWTNGHCVRCHKRRVTGKAVAATPTARASARGTERASPSRAQGSTRPWTPSSGATAADSSSARRKTAHGASASFWG